MARRPRLILPAVPLHIIQRGNNRSTCFVGDTDRRVYLSMLQAYAVETACDVHAYVLMTNHVHLLLSARSETGPSALMRRLGQHYVQYFNRRHGRTGTLWEGRFRSCPVEQESYFLTCQRYIELNPVRAGMVDDPATHSWSSYRANAFGEQDALVTAHPAYLRLGSGIEERQSAYRALFQQALPELQLQQIRHAINGNVPIGTTPRLPGRPRREKSRIPQAKLALTPNSK